MSIQSRYDAIMKDMITLMQQALFRFFTQKQVDLGKFKQYFDHFYKGLIKLEQQFHQKCTKFSKSMNKLSQLFATNATPYKFALQPTSINIKQELKQGSLSKRRPVQNYTSLKIIGEQQQLNDNKQKQRRSGTAEGKRRSSQNYIIDFSKVQLRPRSGVSGVSGTSKRYKSIQANNINIVTNQALSNQGDIDTNYFKTFTSKDFDEFNNANNKQSKKQRKNIYNQLQKQQKGKTQIIYENMIKIPKKKSISTHRWSFKINQLF